MIFHSYVSLPEGIVDQLLEYHTIPYPCIWRSAWAKLGPTSRSMLRPTCWKVSRLEDCAGGQAADLGWFNDGVMLKSPTFVVPNVPKGLDGLDLHIHRVPQNQVVLSSCYSWTIEFWDNSLCQTSPHPFKLYAQNLPQLLFRRGYGFKLHKQRKRGLPAASGPCWTSRGVGLAMIKLWCLANFLSNIPGMFVSDMPCWSRLFFLPILGDGTNTTVLSTIHRDERSDCSWNILESHSW